MYRRNKFIQTVFQDNIIFDYNKTNMLIIKKPLYVKKTNSNDDINLSW